MIRFWLSLCLSISASFLFVGNVLAHPHVWVDSQYRIAVNQPKIDTLEGTWSLDLFTSISLTAEYDVDSDGEFTGQEKVEMIDVLTSFENYGYFIKMKQDGVEMVPTDVRILDVRIRDQMLWVRFAITLPTPVNLETSTLSLAFGDDELYFAMEPLEEGLVRLSGALSETCTPIKREAEEMSVASWIDLTCKS